MQRYSLRLQHCLYPVSYTHLDVYKRQVRATVEYRWISRMAVSYTHLDSLNGHLAVFRAEKSRRTGTVAEMPQL